jgi:NADH dehydrogenase (ubiquinone) flavoprotein 1
LIVQEIKDSGASGGVLIPRLEVELHAQGYRRPSQFLVVNADESEPGTARIAIMRKDPHKLIEGCLSSPPCAHEPPTFTFAGEYFNEAVVLDEAIHEVYAAGLIGKTFAVRDTI